MAVILLTLGCGRADPPHRAAEAKQPIRSASAPVSTAASEVVPHPGKLHVFGDWIVGCDNSGNCTATSLLPDTDNNRDQILSMSVNRTAAGELDIELNSMQFDGDAGMMIVGKRHFALNNGAQLDPPQGDPQVKGAEAAAFLRLRFAGKPIAVVDRKGKRLGFVASKGLEQAIAYMDAVQRPLGGKPLPVPVIRNAYQPSARPLPVSTSQLHQLREALRHRNRDCDSEGSDEDGSIRPLDADHSLVLVICWGGNRNQQYAVYIARRAGSEVTIQPADYDFPAHHSGELLYINTEEGAEQSGDDGWLRQYFGGDPAGDPHSYGPLPDYVWDGTRFRLADLTEASSLKHGYHDEITTWSAKVVPR